MKKPQGMSKGGWVTKIVVSIIFGAIFYFLWEWDPRAFFLFFAFSWISPLYNIFYILQEIKKRLMMK